MQTPTIVNSITEGTRLIPQFKHTNIIHACGHVGQCLAAKGKKPLLIIALQYPCQKCSSEKRLVS
jgi:hypothetical protein